jgi:hypothetical protein
MVATLLQEMAMKLPSVSNLSGGIAGLLTWVITDIILPHYGVVLSSDIDVSIAMFANILVTHIGEHVSIVKDVDAKIKDVAKDLPQVVAEYPDPLKDKPRGG